MAMGLLFTLNLSLGSVSIPFSQILGMLLGQEAQKPIWSTIFWEVRVLKALGACLCGMGLALSGLQLQTLFRNPLVGPYVLGISSGASLGVALLLMGSGVLGGLVAGAPSGWSPALAAIFGSGLICFFMLWVSTRIPSSITLLVLGLMLGYVTSSAVTILMYLTPADQLQSYVFWTFGSFERLQWTQVPLFCTAILLGSLISLFQIKSLNVLRLGEEAAQNLGNRPQQTRLWVLLSTSLLAGSCTAYCGPIAFIGIAVPHLTRMILGTGNHHWLLPGTCLMGINIALLADVIANLPGREFSLPLNAVTSLLGAPVIIWILISSRKNNREWL